MVTVDASGASGFGHGKVILLGEHAVVYGHAALAGALELGVRAAARAAAMDRVRVAAWGVDVTEGPIVTAVRAMAAGIRGSGPGSEGWEIEAEATVPSRAGLGSSAALLVACARAIGGAGNAETKEPPPPHRGWGGSYHVPLTNELIEAAAQAGERVFHGNPSGIDAALATRGGLGLFRRGAGLTTIASEPFTLAIGLSGEARDTAARVAEVARRREADGDADRRLAAMGELALAGERALREGRRDALGALFDRAQEHLAALGVSTAKLDRLCEIARAAGALGAKLTGAGGGGAVIALAPGREADVLAAWRTAGFDGMVARVGVPGTSA